MIIQPKSNLRFFAFWGINAPLDEVRLCRQLDEMCRDGLDGVVFHPRSYPDQPAYLSEEYLRIVSRVILHARDCGLIFWLYDENGWPSGKVLRPDPQAAGQVLTLHRGNAPGAWYSFVHGGEHWHLQKHSGGIDYLNSRVCRQFMRLVHERYKNRLDPAAWDHVEAFFTDEPRLAPAGGLAKKSEGGAVCWNNSVAELYQERFERDIYQDLPFVFIDSKDGAHEPVRRRFWELMTDQFCEGFLAPYQAWCQREGKLFTGHLKGEEHPLFQVMMNGSCHQAYRYFDVPGIDSLERFPNGDFYPRQAASAALQFGKGRVMAEVMGGSGWGTSPEDVEGKFLWLADHGVTDLVIHLYQYRLHSEALRDWPPSHPNGFNWRKIYPEVLEQVRQKVDASSVNAAEVLVLAPYRGIMASYEPWSFPHCNEHNCATYPDTRAGRLNTDFLHLLNRLPADHHFTDERSFEEFSRVQGGHLVLGEHKYSSVIMADGACLDETGHRLLNEFRTAGGSVLKSGDVETQDRKVSPAGAEHSGNLLEIAWEEVVPPDTNALFLELSPETDAKKWWQTAFTVQNSVHEPLTVYFADDVSAVEMDGESIGVSATEEGSCVNLPPSAASPGTHALRFQLKEDDKGPVFVWLKGLFRVISQREWNAGPGEMIHTSGPWALEPTDPPSGGDEMVIAGWPFANQAFSATGTLKTTATVPEKTRIKLQGIKADAAKIVLDGNDLGWTLGPDWHVELSEKLLSGQHQLELQIFPSTFNYYGPHHYIDGDRHIISPNQVTGGSKNFADRPDAPAQIHDNKWRFHPLFLPGKIILTKQ